MGCGKKAKSKALLYGIFLSIAGCLITGSMSANAADRFAPPDFLFTAKAVYHWVDAPFFKPVSIELNAGQVIGRTLYLGGASDYWLATRTDSGASQALKLINLGLEAGFFRARHRVYWLLTATVFYPLLGEVSASTGELYYLAIIRPTYRLRGSVGVRLSSYIALVLGMAFSFQDLGVAVTTTGVETPGLTIGRFSFSGGFAFTL